jgi:hypothetical protein
LALQVAAALDRSKLEVELILARGDATAVAAEVEWRRLNRPTPAYVETDSHTFAGPGDEGGLRDAVLAALARLS